MTKKLTENEKIDKFCEKFKLYETGLLDVLWLKLAEAEECRKSDIDDWNYARKKGWVEGDYEPDYGGWEQEIADQAYSLLRLCYETHFGKGIDDGLDPDGE